MVLPAFPFSLFDFKYINKFEPICHQVDAAAGDAIPETVIYEVPEHKFALLLGIHVLSTKTTSTEFICYIIRNKENMEIKGLPDTTAIANALITETLGDTEALVSWPAAKTPSLWVPAWHLYFLHAGDKIAISHALTALETIEDIVTVQRIEYNDPRWEE